MVDIYSFDVAVRNLYLRSFPLIILLTVLYWNKLWYFYNLKSEQNSGVFCTRISLIHERDTLRKLTTGSLTRQCGSVVRLPNRAPRESSEMKATTHVTCSDKVFLFISQHPFNGDYHSCSPMAVVLTIDSIPSISDTRVQRGPPEPLTIVGCNIVDYTMY